MKNILSKYGVLLLGLFMSGACSSETDSLVEPEVKPEAFRTITVDVSLASRTTIEYESSDYSHLVWKTGDCVAYTTDVAGDVFRTASVSHNSFTASVPESATSANTLTIVYPAGNLEGKKLTEARLETGNPVVHNVDDGFDGSRLPMVSSMPVPAASVVVADFKVLPAVVRLSIKGVSNEEEILKSVTLSAKEALSGSYTMMAGTWMFEGGQNSLTFDIEGKNPSFSELRMGKRYIYFVVPRATYSDLSLTVRSNASAYTLEGGAMDLTAPDRSLYRLDVTLGEPDTPEVPKEPRYVKITSATDISGADTDRYLIVCEGKNSLFAEFDSGNYHYAVPTTIAADGIDPESSEAQKCQLSLGHPQGEYASRYFIYAHNIRSGKPYVGCMSNFSGTPGKFAFRASITSGSSIDCWDISFDGDGNARIQARPNTQDVEGDVFLGYSNSKKAFCMYGSDASSSDIVPLQIYKLVK